MASSGKALFLEAMKLDESNELLQATSKYLEALLQFGTVLLETSRKHSAIELQSKTFGDQANAAMQCLTRVYAIHQHFQKQANSHSAPVLTLSPEQSTVEKPMVSPASTPSVSPNSTLRHTESTIRPQRSPNHESKPGDPLNAAMENNRRLISQFQDLIRQKQQQQGPLSEAQVAHMETELQRKMTENLALAEHQRRLATLAPGSSNTVPRGFGRSSKSLSEDPDAGHKSRPRLAKKPSKKRLSVGITQWATPASHDTLGLNMALGDRWRSKSGDRTHTHRLSSQTSWFDESEFAHALEDGDSDNEVPVPANGALLPTIEDTFGAEACAALTPDQKHQQQVILELIHTERTHVRAMKVLQKVFYRPLSRSNVLPRNFVAYMPVTFLELLFANLDEVVEVHTVIGKRLKAIEKDRRIVHDIGSVLSEFFDGDFSEKFKKAVARFCQHQQFALEQLQLRRQQDNAFSSLVTTAEAHPACHGFKLSDFLPTEMQRLSKYPLLFERLLKYADQRDTKEVERLKRCHQNAQQILAHMNACKRDFENSKRLAELQSRLDTAPFYRVEHPLVSEFRKFNILQHGFIYEGPLRMQRLDNTVIEMHGVLCEKILVLLTKRGLGADERLRLQFHEDSVFVGANKQSVLVQFCPIIKLADAKLKDAASCERDFYIISTIGEVTLYHLATPDADSKLAWTKRIQKQIDNISPASRPSGSSPRSDGPAASSSVAPSGDSPTPPKAAHPESEIKVVIEDEDEDTDFADFSEDGEEQEEEDFRASEQSERLETNV